MTVSKSQIINICKIWRGKQHVHFKTAYLFHEPEVLYGRIQEVAIVTDAGVERCPLGVEQVDLPTDVHRVVVLVLNHQLGRACEVSDLLLNQLWGGVEIVLQLITVFNSNN